MDDNQIERLKAEWDQEKNAPLRFEDVTPGSDRKVWWRCDKGHSWQAKVSNRFRGTGCPFCAGHRILPGENDLQTVYPEIAQEWHPTKNGDLSPGEVAPHSNQYAWWKCVEGHEWKAKINNRTSNHCGCPYCQGTLPIEGENDLAVSFPEIAKEWHSEKNFPLTPEKVSIQSNRAVWWLCEKKHEWQAKICHRVDGEGCPYCNGQKAIQGETDLRTVAPEIAAQWHPTKNENKKPDEYMPYSHARVWWKCELGHEWQARIIDRMKCGCPICGGRQVLSGFNDLKTLAPELAAEWCYDKNGETLPEQVAFHSTKSYFWVCDKGHIWKAKPNNRANGTGCPYCKQNRLIPEKTSLAAVNPELAREWAGDLNDGKTPMDVTAFDNNSYWWRCKKGHTWRASVSNRSKGDGCPYCAGHLAIPGENDLATLYPEIAAQWCEERNGDKKPEQFRPGSNEKVWWRCERGHEWETMITSRVEGHGCPYCSGLLAIPGENDLTTLFPDIAAQWNREKNGDKVPEQFLPMSACKVWWKCQKGHEWKSAISSRTAGSGCPYCSKRFRGHRRLI